MERSGCFERRRRPHVLWTSILSAYDAQLAEANDPATIAARAKVALLRNDSAPIAERLNALPVAMSAVAATFQGMDGDGPRQSTAALAEERIKIRKTASPSYSARRAKGLAGVA